MEGDVSSLARMRGDRPRGTLAILGIGILAISTAAPLIKLVPDVPPLVVAAFRLGLAALLFTPLSLVRLRTAGGSLSLPDLRVVSVAGLCLALHFAAWIASLRYTSVASSVALVTMNPLLLAIAGYLIWRERLARRQWCGIGLALLGSLCIGWNDFQQAGPARESALYGDLLAVGGAVMISAYLLCGRLARPRLGLGVYVGLVYGCAAVMVLAGCLALQLPLLGYAPRAYLVLVLLALIPQVLGHTILNWALAYLSPTLVALAILGEPLGAALLACIFLDESVGLLQGLGAVGLLTGIVLGQPR